MSSAPCGDPGLPGSSTPFLFGKAASLASYNSLVPILVGRFSPDSPFFALPSPRDSRLDEPPERTAVA